MIVGVMLEFNKESKLNHIRERGKNEEKKRKKKKTKFHKYCFNIVYRIRCHCCRQRSGSSSTQHYTNENSN